MFFTVDTRYTSQCGSNSCFQLLHWERVQLGHSRQSPIGCTQLQSFFVPAVSCHSPHKVFVYLIHVSSCNNLSFFSLESLVIKCYKHDSLFLAEIISALLCTFAWLSHTVYVLVLKQRVSRSLRGPLSSLTAWFLLLIPDICICGCN